MSSREQIILQHIAILFVVTSAFEICPKNCNGESSNVVVFNIFQSKQIYVILAFYFHEAEPLFRAYQINK